ncbi:Acetyltransferase (GNAT) domain protein [uncultured archaeon]|nr:Acetyltransferase (GNAT) domain protein [uncultured archaeon]
MKIRKATGKDLKQIARIFINEYSKFPYEENWKENIVLAKVKKYLRSERKIFVLTVDKEITGFIIFSKNIWDDGDHLVIDELVIDSKFQGRGIGKQLMSFAEKYFNHIVSIDLWTFRKAKAYKIYKKWGYKDHQHGIMMTKKIK